MTIILRPGSVSFLRMLLRFADHRADGYTKHLAKQLLGTANVTLTIKFLYIGAMLLISSTF
jgi:hypothetical protein